MIKKCIAIMLSLITAFAFCACASGESVAVIEGESKIIRLYIGQEGRFDNSSYSYVTDNPEVLSLQGNAYKGLKEGSASVTVKNAQNGSVAVYLFVVFGNKPIPLTELTITNAPTSNNITVGQTAKLSYQKIPANADEYDAIVWSSSDSEVLSVDRNGNITANKMGEATLTVSALGTSVQKQITVSVLPRDTVFELNLNSVIGVKGESEELLVADVLCDYPMEGEVEWFTENENVVTVDNGTLTFKEIGETTVGIKARINGADYTASCTVKVKEDEGFVIIRTPEQLQDIASASANYMLGNDIDLKDACAEGGALYNEGKGFMPLFEDAKNAFKGIFEGNGYAIRNIMINRENDAFVALMRYISAEKGKEGVIRNLSIIGGSIKGNNYTSVFYANSSGYGSLESGLRNCYAELELASLGSLSCLVGNNKGIVENCITNVTFDALGKTCLFALNHTVESDLYGVRNCVYIGEQTQTMQANITNGGFITDCFAITFNEVATFNFNLGDGWKYTAGEIPTVKGV